MLARVKEAARPQHSHDGTCDGSYRQRGTCDVLKYLIAHDHIEHCLRTEYGDTYVACNDPVFGVHAPVRAPTLKYEFPYRGVHQRSRRAKRAEVANAPRAPLMQRQKRRLVLEEKVMEANESILQDALAARMSRQSFKRA